MIRKDVFFTFLILIFFPLVILAYFSTTTFNKIESYNARNLASDISVVRLLHNNSDKELDNIVAEKSATIAESQNSLMNLKKQSMTLIILTILVIGGLVTVAAHIMSQSLISSLNQITEVARAVKYGDLSKRVKISTKDKVAQLGININKMIESLQDRENRIKEYQREIHSQKEYLEALFNSLIDGVITISRDCKITKINQTVAVWLGMEEEEIIGKSLTNILKCACSVNCEMLQEDISEICPLISQNERLCPTEAVIRNTRTKAEKSLGLNSSLVSGIEGEPSYVIVLRDITEFKEMEIIKKDFIATLTHDLRVPILAEATTLKFFLRGSFGTYNDKQKEAIENMLESNNDLLNLVNSLLDTYKYEDDQDELSKESVNIRQLVHDCIAELTPIAKKNNQTLTNLVSKEIPDVNVDKKEIKRVLMNLMNNGLTYSHKGGAVAVGAEEQLNQVVVKVTDNGKGIPSEEQEVIFDRYFSKAKKLRKIGTGLGLYLSKKIIEKHNGAIWVESQVNKGSTFYFSLPTNS